MGTLYSGFAADLLAAIFNNTNKVGLGTAELTPVAVGQYADQPGSAAVWSHTTESGRPTVVNSKKFYFPDVTADYTATHFHVKASFGDKTNAIVISIPFTDQNGDAAPLAAVTGEQIKINKYVAGAGRGVKVQLWLPEV